jgi:hypothetical protein
MKLVLALTEGDPEGKGAEGEDPMREVGVDKYPKKDARSKEEGVGGSEGKELDST